MNAVCLRTFAVLFALAQIAAAQTPEWIWHANGGKAPGNYERRFFRKTFTLDAKPTKATLAASVDNEGTAFVNAKSVATIVSWEQAVAVDVTADLKTGENILAIRGINHGGAAGAVARLEMTFADGKKQSIVTDLTWLAHSEDIVGWQTADYKKEGWEKPISVAKLGAQPWGDVLSGGGAKGAKGAPKAAGKREATPADQLYTLAGFKTELLISAEPEEGSWVNLCKDNKGRLILSPQHRGANPDGGLLRVTLGKDGKVAKREFIAKPLYDAQGMTFANGALWVVVNKYSTSFASGLYRITDDGSDTWSKIELIKALPGGGEHGPHADELGPDGNLYVMAGNHTKPPADLAPTSPHKNWAEDHVLPRQPDGNGHATGVMAPGGYVCRVSPDGKNWDFYCGGFRNQFDFAFNPDGELFVFDADMEWDWGMPWYRATRVNHATSGAEFGWRYGTGKWPDYHADSLGSVVDIGIGCPTGVSNGKGAKFPATYQRAIYIMDWTYGRLMAVHLKPEGASYTATWENFVAPAGLVKPGEPKPPLNVTDLVIGDDGAMYFTIGGRGTAAGLYRVTYTGKESTAAAWEPNKEGAEARALRRKLEAFHGKADPKALDFIWPHLNSPDRALRYAARIALEAQPVTTWQTRALEEKTADGGLAALLALARLGGKSAQDECLRALGKWPLATLPERQQLDNLRVIQVSIARNGLPSADVVKLATEKLSTSYPNKSNFVNRELSQVLIALGAPGAVDKTLSLMAGALTQEDMIHYLFHLRTAKNWTPDQRKEYLGYWAQDRSPAAHQGDTVKWFEEAGRPYGHGSSYNNFFKNFLKEATSNLTDAEKGELAPLLASLPAGAPSRRNGVSDFPKPQTRSFVKAWTMADFEADLAKPLKGRNFEKGRQAFVDGQCLACHRFGIEGGGIGPDLTAVSARFSRRDVLESILDPSKVVSEQFQNTTVWLKNGDDHTGRLMSETGDTLVLVPNQLQPDTKITVKKADVTKRAFSKISPMPQGLVDALNKEDLLDLLALLESYGRKNSAAFAK
ncbi:MAG: heme-binding protein [Limisphaerales bacterium]